MLTLDTRDLSVFPPPESVDDVDQRDEADRPQWFAIAVKPRYDKVVARILATKGFETFLPLYTKQHRYGERCKRSELPVFPGYMFCRFNAKRRLPILTTPGVTSILGTGNRPSPLPEAEITSLQTAIKARIPLLPFPFIQVGHRVRIEAGVLAGVVGTVVKVGQSARLVLSVTLLHRSVLLEIDRSHLCPEPEPKASAAYIGSWYLASI